MRSEKHRQFCVKCSTNSPFKSIVRRKTKWIEKEGPATVMNVVLT